MTGIFIIIILFIALLYIVFKPNIDVISAGESKRTFILWYNRTLYDTGREYKVLFTI